MPFSKNSAFSWGWAAWLLALALVPDQKGLRLKLLVVESGLLALAWGWAANRPKVWRRTPLDLSVGAYALSALVFYFLSPQPRNSETELARVLFCAGAFFAAAQAELKLKFLLRVWAAAAALAAAVAVFQKFGAIQRPYGTFGNPIFLASFLGASMPATALLLVESDGLELLACLAALLLQGSGLWLAQSRAGFAGLLAAGTVWALLRLSGPRRLRLVAALTLLAAGLAWQWRGRQWTHPLIWTDALALWRAHPWLGCGLGRFHIEFPQYASMATRAMWPQAKVIVNFAHNEYLQVLAETGVVGLALFLAVPANFLTALLRRSAGELEPAPALAAVALFTCAFFSPDMRFGVSAPLAFAALGFWAGQAPQEKPLSITGRYAAVALVLAWAAAAGLLAARPALAERRLAHEPSFAIQATPEVREAIAKLEAAAEASPKDADLAEQTAYLYARAQAMEPAAHWFEKAAAIAPSRPGPWNNLGNLAYLRGDAETAIVDWERSLKAAPGQLDAHLNLAKLYYEKGRVKEAAAHCEAALKLDPANAKARVLLKKMVE